MIVTIAAEVVPLREEAGVIRVAGTRVTLDTVISVFNAGATPEEIAQRYPTLQLADVYAVIGYYLHHRSEVDTYLHERERQADAIQKENEARFNPSGLRERLLARRAAQR
ncbi:MAG: DUF433 domain-containing protein [Acidobacteriota bacterium]